MFADYHVHTEFSDDSEYKMEAVVKDAINLGIDELCFTDHVDYGIKLDWDDPGPHERRAGGEGEPELMDLLNVDYPRYFETIEELKLLYDDRITIKRGLEFGMQRHTVPLYEALFEKYELDFVILSVHQIEDKEFWNREFQRGRTQDEYNLRYYEEVLHLVKAYKNYSVLGHLDLIRRYDDKGDCPFERVEPIITEILKQVIADGKGIEVNTSSYRYGIDDLCPSRRILRLYHELGGRIITLGSDSHKKEHLGAHIMEVRHELKKMGFDTFFTFKNMKAKGWEIE